MCEYSRGRLQHHGRVKVLSWQLEVVAISDRGELTVPSDFRGLNHFFFLETWYSWGHTGAFTKTWAVNKEGNDRIRQGYMDMVPTCSNVKTPTAQLLRPFPEV